MAPFLHFVNCAGLTYGPCALVYQLSGIREEGALNKCVWSGFVYLLVTMAKMLTLATLFPSISSHEAGGVGSAPAVGGGTPHVIRSALDVADFAAFYALLHWKAINFQSSTKILVVGLGWATMELVVSQLLPLWQLSRKSQFSWAGVQAGLDSNILLLLRISAVLTLYLWTRPAIRKRAPSTTFLVPGFVVFYCFWPQILSLFGVLGAWELLAAKAAASVALGLALVAAYRQV